ncbi:DUF922 domain-containing protein [Sphingomonas sp. AOB5]|uniref:DUF922 domain-containing protein n=1 Tax=Sphingomonas sp. AOB5 TaxID=3034017 RepID=UPI0023F981BF|nr:DUF922 domain-containing protein [Sphingomonas sp. AOB5]MDF7776537.1 DUF922 domain-containing protein [Sphingomonas sp. AOB5]
MTRLALSLRAAALAIVLAVPVAAFQAVPADPFDGIPNVEFVYYDVTGTSAKEIRESMNAKGLVDPNDGNRVDAIARWRFAWQWPRTLDGTCDLSRAEVRFNAVVTLPRLVSDEKLDRPTRTKWQRYMKSLREHEAGHIRPPYDDRNQLLDAIKGSDCAGASAAAHAVIARFGARDREYDAKTQHGAKQGARFP